MMLDLRKSKKKRIITAVIAIAIVAAMLITMIIGAFFI